MELRLLGPIEAESGGRLAVIVRRQERLLLAILALEAGRLVPSSRLASLLWPTGPPDGVRQILQTCISRLRTALKDIGAHDAIIVRRDGGYLIDVRPSDVDVHRFDDMVRRALADPSVAGRAALLRAALALWRGPALGDLSLHPPQIALRTGLDERRRSALLERMAADLTLGQATDLVAEILVALDESPTDERLIALLMRAYAASGRRDEALHVFQVARRRSADELGLDPGPDLAAVHTAILRNEAVPPGYAAPLPIPSQLPRPIDPFVGREAELALLHELHRRLQRTGTAGPVVIDGPGGVGKTALAVWFAYEVVGEFPDGQLFLGLNGYAGGTEPTDPRTALREALSAFGVEDPPAELSALTGLYRSMLSGRRVLVVLDNARTAEQVRPLLPNAPGCMVLVTSRGHLTGLAVTDSSASVPLTVMDEGDAARLLTARLGAARTEAEPEALDQLIRACAGLPLALSVVAARATAKPAFPLLAFADEVAQPGQLLTAFANADLSSDLQTVLSWSYDQLGPAAATTFRLLGLPGGSHVSIEAVESLTAAGRTPTVRALRELEEANLIGEESPGRFVMHDLLKAYAIELAAGAGTPEAAVSRLLSHYLRTGHAASLLMFPERPRDRLIDVVEGVVVPALSDRGAALEWFGRESAALVAAVEIAAGRHMDSMVIALGSVISDYFFRSGNVREAIVIHRAVATALERSGEPARRGITLRAIGNAFVRLHEPENAIAHFRMALQCFDADEDPALPASIHLGLAKAADQQGRHEDSLMYALEALPLYRSAGNARTICRALNTVGYCYARTENYPAALDFCTEALELSATVDDPHGLAAIWDSLGYIHRGLGDFDAARDGFTRAIGMYAALDDLYQQADSLAHLGDSEEAAGRSESAQQCRLQAIEYLDRLGHPTAEHLRSRLHRSSEH